MKILITGGAGFIGSHACVAFLNAGYNIVVVDNLSNSRYEVLERVKQITQKDFPFHRVDVTSQDEVDQIFKEYNFDAVVHFAGLKAVGESVEKPLEYYHNNVIGSAVITKACLKHDVNKFIFSSSCTVYGNNKSPFAETMALLPATNPYGRSKAIVEQMLTDVAFAQPKFSVSILRYFNPVGAHESGLIGEEPIGVPNNLMPYITQVAKGQLKQLKIFGNDYPTPDGTAIRDYVHVMDLVEGHMAALEKITPGISVYNLGTGKGISVLEIVNAFKKENHHSINFIFSHRREGDLPVTYADVAKAKLYLGWEAKRNVADMCRDAWRFEKNREFIDKKPLS